jgi:hypothetical protein
MVPIPANFYLIPEPWYSNFEILFFTKDLGLNRSQMDLAKNLHAYVL